MMILESAAKVKKIIIIIICPRSAYLGSMMEKKKVWAMTWA